MGAGPVIYWCSRDQRVRDNWALIYACDTANATGAPVAVVFSLVTSFLGAGARQFCFMLKGLREMEQALLAKNIKFVLLEGDPSLTVPRFAKECGASLIVADQSPLRLGRTWRVAIASSASCPLHEVDAHNIVPVWEASQKLEVGARTLRGKLAKLYPEFLVEFPEAPVVKGTWPCEAAAALPTMALIGKRSSSGLVMTDQPFRRSPGLFRRVCCACYATAFPHSSSEVLRASERSG